MKKKHKREEKRGEEWEESRYWYQQFDVLYAIKSPALFTSVYSTAADFAFGRRRGRSISLTEMCLGRTVFLADFKIAFGTGVTESLVYMLRIAIHGKFRPRTVPPATHNGDFCYSDKHLCPFAPRPTDLIPAPCSPGCISQQLVVHNYLCSPGAHLFPPALFSHLVGTIVELMDVDTWPLTSRDAPQ
ncbi:hypothetical protein CDAR_385431 [Caerostris darwini]|uniref:Uncharacterized protein n=1 Tax=Caerostris darwini TaxID=1538125 RepID=A0AAV4N049_9ARAC|nr:hypothetical protein CDAR_385431 [Caerostris darwini]